MSRVVIVDWLGRGGIAQTSEEWARAVERSGHEAVVVTRAQRPLALQRTGGTITSRGGNRFLDLADVVRQAVRAVRSMLPDLLVVQNYVVPEVERAVLLAAKRSGVRSVLVAHEPALTRYPRPRRSALSRQVRAADVVVCHSRYVADRLVARQPELRPLVVPLPVCTALVELAGTTPSLLPSDGRPTALLFGHLHRDYKGGDRLVELAAHGVPGWRLAAVGKEAPSVPGLVTVSRFVTDAELASTVASCAVTLLPYDRAAQSGAVSLAQSLGSVVIATRVGGIGEQVEAGTGVLLEQDAGVEQWREALLSLDRPRLEEMSATARVASTARQAEFMRHVGALLAAT